jgi:hypothetical protein
MLVHTIVDGDGSVHNDKEVVMKTVSYDGWEELQHTGLL